MVVRKKGYGCVGLGPGGGKKAQVYLQELEGCESVLGQCHPFAFPEGNSVFRPATTFGVSSFDVILRARVQLPEKSMLELGT